MKLNLHTIQFVTISLLIAAARCAGAPAPPPPITGTVTFEGSGASLTPGEGWARYEPPPNSGIFLRDGTPCPPIIVGESGTLSVSLREMQQSSLEAMAARVREECDRLPTADWRSFRRGPFVTENGVRGLHVSYVQRNVQPDGRTAKTRCHHYFVIRPDGRGVDIAYLANAERDAKAAHEMIRKSLSVQTVAVAIHASRGPAR